jgi:hypothetical protein
MAYDAFAQQDEMTHLVGDVPLLFGLAVILIWLHPRHRGAASTGAPDVAPARHPAPGA